MNAPKVDNKKQKRLPARAQIVNVNVVASCDHAIGDVCSYPFIVKGGDEWCLTWCSRCGALRQSRGAVVGDWELPRTMLAMAGPG